MTPQPPGDTHALPDTAAPGGGWVGRRWRGQVPWRTLLWRDLLGVGTAVNLLATFVALILASQGVATWVAVLVHFLPLPYNLFLCLAVSRARPASRLATAVALGWLVLMTLV